MKILQIIGYKNSGKTTLITALIQYLTAHGQTVGAIKHHGHAGALAPLQKDSTGYLSDSERFLHAGALASAIISPTDSQLLLNETFPFPTLYDLHAHDSAENWTLSSLLKLYRSVPLEVVILEGFKSAPYPKIAVATDASSLADGPHRIGTLVGKERTLQQLLSYVNNIPSVPPEEVLIPQPE